VAGNRLIQQVSNRGFRFCSWVVAFVFCLVLLAGCRNPDEGQKSPSGSGGSGSADPPRTTALSPRSSARQLRSSSQSFTLVDNTRARITDYLGTVVVLDFWATYCPPCLEEAPHLDSLQKQFGDQGLNIIGLNVGGPDDQEKIPQFAKQFGINYALGFPDPEMTSLYLKDDDRIPQTLVFDRRGKLVKHFVGFDDTIKADMERVIRQSLNDVAD
jgi:thiol-disulfide isomerase/thioredoxin